MIQLSCLTKAFGDRTLLDGVTWQIGDRDRVGLCGPNGAGKTTLLRMLARLDEPDTGDIVTPVGLTMGYLPQDGLVHQGRTLIDEVRTAFQPLLDVKKEMHALEERLGDASIHEDEHERMLVRYAELQDRFRHEDGYSIDLRVGTVLHGLGFTDADEDKRCETFSGGWQMRIALAKLLLGRPGLLLLDEPTNHLDLDARNWLEEYLREYPYAVILVSHDRYFLDEVTTKITEINLRTLTDYRGNYSDYLRESQARIDRLRQLKKEQDEEVARIRLFVDRFRYKATKAAQVQSRVKMLEKIVPIEVPPERKRVHFQFPGCEKSGRTVLEMRHVQKAYDGKVVFRDANVHVERGDRIALVGPNGAGKSTLMRMLSGAEPSDAGTCEPGHQVVMQYFAQDEADRLEKTLTVYETLAAGSSLAMVPAIRNILGGFLFSGDDVYKKVGVLSGGERTRLAVARMLLRPSNTLLLDEPTNHLDLDSKDVLLDALEDFGGTLILVSHDRYFIDKLATKVIEIGSGEATMFLGNYEELLWRHKQHGKEVGAAVRLSAVSRADRPVEGQAASTGAPVAAAAPGATAEPAADVKAAAETTPAPSGSRDARPSSTPRHPRVAAQAPRPSPGPRLVRPGADSNATAGAPKQSNPRPPARPGSDRERSGAIAREEKKRLEAEARRRRRADEALQMRITEVETKIADRERELKDIETKMSAPGFYEDHVASKPILDRHHTLMWEIGDLLHRWEELQGQTASSRG